MSFERIYILASAMIAVLIWIEASWMLKNAGKLPQSALFAWISLMTTAWLAVSGLALFFLEFDGLQMSVPASYGVYLLASWLYGAKMISNTDADDPMDFVMPDKYLNFCRAFALVFFALCALVLVVPELSLSAVFDK